MQICRHTEQGCRNGPASLVLVRSLSAIGNFAKDRDTLIE